MNFNNYKFRASSLTLLMKTNKGKAATDLNDTIKSKLNEIYIFEKYGRKPILTNKYLSKGTEREDEAIEMLSDLTGVFAQKNEQYFENEFLCGTPDLIFDDKIVDIKCSWNFMTFIKSGLESAIEDYFWQLLAYNLLVFKELRAGQIVYCLLDNSQEELEKELKWTLKNQGYDPENYTNNFEAEKLVRQIIKNNRFNDLDLHQKLKIIDLTFEDVNEANIYIRLAECRKYLNSLEF